MLSVNAQAVLIEPLCNVTRRLKSRMGAILERKAPPKRGERNIMSIVRLAQPHGAGKVCYVQSKAV